MKYCSKCGKEIQESTTFCPNCGAQIGNYNIQDRKSKLVAGLLAIFVGTLGIHNFYLGYTSKGVTQLLLTLLSCGILSFVTYIWSLIEGIYILIGKIDTDAKGIKLTD